MAAPSAKATLVELRQLRTELFLEADADLFDLCVRQEDQVCCSTPCKASTSLPFTRVPL